MYDDVAHAVAEDDADVGVGVVVPFPSRRSEATAEERLAGVLASLRRALAEQEHAMAEWREALGDLGAALSGLHGSLLRYGTALDGLALSVDALHGEAERLEALPV